MHDTTPFDADVSDLPPHQPEPKRPSALRRRLKTCLRIVFAVFLVVLVIGWWNILRIDMGDHWPPPADAITAAEAESMTEAFARRENPRRDDIAVDYAPSTASEIDLFNGGVEFLPGMLGDIENAHSSVHLAMFAFTPGVWGDRFSDALIERARAGVTVRVTLDRHGSKITGRSQKMFEDMAAAGVIIVANDAFPIQASGPLPDRDKSWSQDEIGQVDHRKLLIVDGTVAWVGGGGLEDHFFTGEFHDVFVRVKGDVVRQLQAVFLTGFRAYGGPLPSGDGALRPYFPAPDDPGHIRVTVLQNVPGGFRPATQATWMLLEQAKTRIDILNPYLSDHGIIDRIIAAANRGVAVNVVIPKESNNPPADAALTHNYPVLLDAGVKLWEYPTVIHAKVLIADDAVIVGSLNYDAWALYRNVELSLLIEDEDVATRVHEAFVAPAIAKSTPAEVATGKTDQIRNWFWDKLTYFL